MITKIGRGSNEEVKDLEVGMDFRDIKYRREVFLRFYDFHLTYNSHPGGVYFAFPWLAARHEMTFEDKLWFAFINGCSQNVVTTYLIWKRFPKLSELTLSELEFWWNEHQYKFKAGSGWDTDRKYFKIGKTGFPQCVASYMKCVEQFGSQEAMFASLCKKGEEHKYENFDRVWDYVRTHFLSFGRLSAFSYLEYLRIQGLNIDCSSLFLDDIKGSKSHRNGLCKVLGRDDLDWYDVEDTHNPDFKGYSKEVLAWLKEEGDLLLAEAKERFAHHGDVSFFTLESTLCCYKSWHRPNRRYPNVYMDMMYNRIKYAEQEWEIELDEFWEMRRDCLPKHLRLEDNPADPGLSKEKQNYYRLYGTPVMMSKEHPCFANEFDNNCWKPYVGLGAFFDA